MEGLAQWVQRGRYSGKDTQRAKALRLLYPSNHVALKPFIPEFCCLVEDHAWLLGVKGNPSHSPPGWKAHPLKGLSRRRERFPRVSVQFSPSSVSVSPTEGASPASEAALPSAGGGSEQHRPTAVRGALWGRLVWHGCYPHALRRDGVRHHGRGGVAHGYTSQRLCH